MHRQPHPECRLRLFARRTGHWACACVLAGLAFGGCTAPDASTPAIPASADEQATARTELPDDSWLEGDLQAQILQVSDHVGGMGAAMLSVGVRHALLHWAGEDQNWPLAAHQLEELVELTEDALVRRPRYAEAAQPWLEVAVPAMQAAIESEDPDTFRAAYDSFTVSCNVCHQLTDHAFIMVHPPEGRSINIRPDVYQPGQDGAAEE